MLNIDNGMGGIDALLGIGSGGDAMAVAANANNQRATGSSVIKKIILVPTSKNYQDVYQRSFDLKANFNDLANLQTIFNNTGVNQNGKLSDVVLAQHMGDVVGINNNTTGKVEVPYGWSTKRLRFMMEVDTPVGGVIKTSYVQGYSEYYEPSLQSNSVDPNMIFHINSITVVSRGNYGGQIVTRPLQTFNVVSDLAGGKKYEEVDIFADSGSALKLIRPTDIIEDLDGANMLGVSDNVVNTTGMISGGANVSSRGNNDNLKFLTKTINSVVAGKNLASADDDMGDVLREASNLTNETLLMDNLFIKELANVTRTISPTTFSLNVLDQINPGVNRVIHLAQGANAIGYLDENSINIGKTIMDAEDSASLLQPNYETKIATTISHALSSMIADNLLTMLDVSFTNTTGFPVVTINFFKSFIEGIDTISYANRVKERIENVLLPELTMINGEELGNIIEVHARADLLGDSNVAVSVNMQPLELYRFPAFADSLFVPVIADNTQRTKLTDDISNMIDMTYGSKLV